MERLLRRTLINLGSCVSLVTAAAADAVRGVRKRLLGVGQWGNPLTLVHEVRLTTMKTLSRHQYGGIRRKR